MISYDLLFGSLCGDSFFLSSWPGMDSVAFQRGFGIVYSQQALALQGSLWPCPANPALTHSMTWNVCQHLTTRNPQSPHSLGYR